MPPALIPSDDEYASEEDSDFAPDDAAATTAQGDGEDSSDDESDAETDKGKGKEKSTTKRKRVGEEAEDAGFENSGDEAIIEKGLKRRKRKEKKGIEDEDEGGDGGLVKTRSMRAQEYVLLSLFLFRGASQIDSMIGKSKRNPLPLPQPRQ